jgi:diguanylate cyclase (GGDEF)-like protein/PAS domain S-box-containing protein
MHRLCAGIFGQASDAVLVTDAERRILWCNAAFERLLGYPLAALAGRRRETLYAPPAGFGAGVEAGCDSAEVEGCTCTLRLMRHDGTILAAQATTWPWTGPGAELGARDPDTAEDSGAPGAPMAPGGPGLSGATGAAAGAAPGIGAAGQVSLFRDRTEAERRQKARQAHGAILTDQRLDEGAKIEAILALACDYFKMPVALVCALDGQTMTVVHAKSALMTVLPGTRFDVSQGLCRATLALDGPCSFADTVEIGENPTFLSYGLRSYIGKKLSLGGHTFGTLSLCSPMEHPDFTSEDTAMIALFAAGVEQLLATEMRLQALEAAATRDWLTGALTNRQFHHDILETFAKVRRNTATASLILFDIDHFKTINDQFGHDMGDRALTEIARRARRVIGPNRKLYRVGGEEFAVILAGSGADSAAIMAERLRAKISEQGFDDALPLITASFGVAELDADLTGVEAWLKCADIALYGSKNNGRNRVTSNRAIAGVALPPEMAARLQPPRERGKKPQRV